MPKVILPLAFFLAAILILALAVKAFAKDHLRATGSATKFPPARESADWSRDATIYSAYLRSASTEGTFAGFQKRIPELKAMGVTVVWFLPIHPVGVKLKKGTLGSPYAVRDYYTVNSEFGTLADFRTLVKTVHDNGLHVIIDLVLDHTSWDNELIETHPEWYKHDAAGKIISPNTNWTDVAALDFSKPGLREYLKQMMCWWVGDVGIDGFRCDVAELVPLDFWVDARKALDSIKPVLMLSEGSKPEHHLSAFDITYSWNLYDIFSALLKGERSAAALDSLVHDEGQRYPEGALRLRFNTNHDKNAWDSPAVLKFGTDGLKLTAILINTLPGIPLLYTGEEVANDRTLGLFEKVSVDWNRSHEMGDLYRSLFVLRKEHRAISRGAYIHVPTPIDRQVFAFWRKLDNDQVLTVVNLSHEEVSTTLNVSDSAVFHHGNGIRITEFFSGTESKMEPTSPFPVNLPAFGYKIFISH